MHFLSERLGLQTYCINTLAVTVESTSIHCPCSRPYYVLACCTNAAIMISNCNDRQLQVKALSHETVAQDETARHVKNHFQIDIMIMLCLSFESFVGQAVT